MTADAVVVGAGIAGPTVALEPARRDLRVRHAIAFPGAPYGALRSLQRGSEGTCDQIRRTRPRSRISPVRDLLPELGLRILAVHGRSPASRPIGASTERSSFWTAYGGVASANSSRCGRAITAVRRMFRGAPVSSVFPARASA